MSGRGPGGGMVGMGMPPARAKDFKGSLRRLIDRLLRQRIVVAHDLAEQIAGFPAECMKVDRMSGHRQWDLPFDAVLRNEGAHGVPIVMAEGVSGAHRFTAGEGRHGQF